MNFVHGATTACVALFLTACTPTTQFTESGTRPITRDYDGGVFDWRGSSTETVLVYDLFNRGGMTEICGAIFTEGTQTLRNTEFELLKAARLEVAGTKVADNLTFFARLRPGQENAMARCVTSGVPWKDAFDSQEPVLRIRTTSFQI